MAAAPNVVTVLVSALVALVGVAVSLGTLFYTRRKDSRESHTQENADVVQALAVKDATIAALEKHNELLEEQLEANKIAGEKREQEWQRREQEWREERSELRRRVGCLEEDYRKLVVTVTTAGVCANAGTCVNRIIPGDRRVEVDASPA